MLGIPNDHRFSAIWVKRELFKKDFNYSIIKRLFVLSITILHRNVFFVRSILRSINNILLLDENYTSFLINNYIDKILLDGLNSFLPVNAKWISSAKKLDINTITIVTNWDHPTTRGYELINSNQYLVWGKSMRDEIIKYHDIKPNKVNITGSVIFDMYSEPTFILSTNQINSNYNNNIPKKYVLFLTHSPYYPYNLELVKYIRKQLQNDITLIIRLHPLYLDDFAKNEFEKHKKFDKANSNLIYCYPNSSNKSLAADMSYEEIQLSASLVANARVVINFMSTMLLDGLISNKKVINIAFDWQKRISHPNPLSLAEYRVHLSRVINAPGSYLARTRDELSTQLFELVNHKYESKDSSIIDEIILKECGIIDGSAAKNISRKIIAA